MIKMSPKLARWLLGPKIMPAAPYADLTLAGVMSTGQYDPAGPGAVPVVLDPSTGSVAAGAVTLAAVAVLGSPVMIPVDSGGWPVR
jgi:hypothetical protein